MESVYLETSFWSYLVSEPSRNILVAANQQLTRDWWQGRRNDFRCVISQVVVDEVSIGNAVESSKRVSAIQGLEKLTATNESLELTQRIVESNILPTKAFQDAAHISIATVQGINYLLTWNCKHLANAQIRKRIDLLCENAGYSIPVICTPSELMEKLDDQ